MNIRGKNTQSTTTAPNQPKPKIVRENLWVDEGIEFKSIFPPTLCDAFFEYHRTRDSPHASQFHLAREASKIILPFLYPILSHERFLVATAKKL